jgi:hypothetical protein
LTVSGSLCSLYSSKLYLLLHIHSLALLQICFLIFSFQNIQVQVTLRLTVSQSVCLGVEPHPGLMIRY